jgi:plasmid stabilization system protein ParE
MILYIRPEAEVDIEEAASWYEKQSEGLGYEFLNEVEKAYKTILENPSLYPAVYRDTHRTLIHRFPFGIFYRIEKGFIVIIAVMHGSRDPKRWKKRS